MTPDDELKQMIKDVFGPYIQEFIKDQVEQQYHDGLKLMPEEVMVEQRTQEALKAAEQQMIAQHQGIMNGFTAIQEELPNLQNQTERKKIIAETLTAGQKIANEEVTILANEEGEAEISIHEKLGISNETLAHFFSISCDLYKKEEFQKAADVMKVTNFLNPFIASYWMGLGMSEHRLSHYQEALNAYAMASFLDEEMPEPLFYSASAYGELGEFDEAEIELEELEELLKQTSNTDVWKEEILKIRKVIEHHRT